MLLPADFLQKYGPWALVTGASGAIGGEFARQLAAAGLSIVLVARREDRLQQLSKELTENYPVQTKIIIADLSTEQGWRTVVADSEGIDLGLVINNAAMEQLGSFFRDSVERHAMLIAVNISSVTAIAHALGRRLADRGRGGMIFVSSLISRPMPWFSTYSASKAYVSALSIILKEELEPKGVDVLCLEPGVVKSEMSDRANANADFAKMGFTVQQPKDCVSETLDSLYKKHTKVTPGFLNKVSMFVMGFIPEGIKMKMLGAAMNNAMNPEMKEYQ